MEEQEALKNCLREFQRARRKLLENAAALATKGMDSSNSSVNKAPRNASADRSGAYVTAKVQQSSISGCMYDDPQGYIPPVCNKGSCDSPVRIL